MNKTKTEIWKATDSGHTFEVTYTSVGILVTPIATDGNNVIIQSALLTTEQFHGLAVTGLIEKEVLEK